jgi:signal transduction histidine kinase
MSAAPDSSAPPSDRRSDSLSLEWKLPIVMTGGIAAALTALLVSTYVVLRGRAEERARDRMSHAVTELARQIGKTLSDRVKQFDAVAQDDAVRRALLDATRGSPTDTAALRRALLPIGASADSSRPAELWDVNGKRLLSVGPALDSAERPPRPSATDTARVHFTSMQQAGKRVRFWVIAAIDDNGRRIGYLAQPRFVTGQTESLKMVREFLLDSVTSYLRNVDASVWVTTPDRSAKPPDRRRSTARGLLAYRPGVGDLFVAESTVPGAPWIMAIEVPASMALDPLVGQTLRLLIPLSLLVVLVGAVLSLFIGRYVTRPLTELTIAAESVSRGTYDRAVTGGRDELGRLAASFDAMARQVATARRELEQRATEADIARREAEGANRSKSNFLAMMSHELRTPLNAIGGYTQLLQMGVHGPLTADQERALARVERSQAHLLALITDILDFARIDAGRVQFNVRDVLVDDVLASVDALATPLLRGRPLAFTCSRCATPLAVRADRDKLCQVLLNLAGNAIKYTPDNGEVSVVADADERVVHMSVRDTGPGIPDDQIGRIFEPFVQGERSLHRPDEGVGLGLAISRELVAGMGGTLSVASEVGRGSIFVVTLPRVTHPTGVVPGISLAASPTAVA